MQAFQQLGSSSSPFIGLFAVFAICLVSWLVSGYFVKKTAKQRELAVAATSSIYDQIKLTRACFAGKYMPLALSKVLGEAEELRRELAHRSYLVERKAHFQAIAAEADATVGQIKAAVAKPFTVAEMEADRLALDAALLAAEEAAATLRAEIEAVYEEDMASCAAKLESDRAAIAQSQEQLAALVG